MQYRKKMMVICLLAMLAFIKTAAAQSPTVNQAPTSEQKPVMELPNKVELSRARTGVDDNKRLPLSLREAVEMAIDNNFDIAVARNDVQIAEQELNGTRGPFDFNFNVFFRYDSEDYPISSLLSKSKAQGVPANLTLENYDYNGSITKLFSEGGLLKIELDNNRLVTDETFTLLQKEYRSTLRISFTQPLERNFRINEAERRVLARKKLLDISDQEFRQRLINVIARVQSAYYDLVFTRKNEEIYREAMELAAIQLHKNEVNIAAGRAAPIDAVSSQAELALRKDEAINALAAITTAENELKNLMFNDLTDGRWDNAIIPTEQIEFSHEPITLATAFDTALSQRPEIKRLEAQGEISKVDIAFFKNQAKPKVDASGAFIGNGLIGERNSVGQTLDKVLIGNYFEGLINALKFRGYQAGLTMSMVYENNTAKANFDNAKLVDHQIDTRKRQMIQNILVEVRNAVQALDAATQRVEAARATVRNAEEQLKGEQTKYDANLSTNFLVLKRQNSLSFARGDELRALTDYRKAWVDLQRVMANNTSAIAHP